MALLQDQAHQLHEDRKVLYAEVKMAIMVKKKKKKMYMATCSIKDSVAWHGSVSKNGKTKKQKE